MSKIDVKGCNELKDLSGSRENFLLPMQVLVTVCAHNEAKAGRLFRTQRTPMSEQPIDKREQYVGFATCCLQMAKMTVDNQTRATLRAMAAEWLMLAEQAYD